MEALAVLGLQTGAAVALGVWRLPFHPACRKWPRNWVGYYGAKAVLALSPGVVCDVHGHHA
jgi:hypothetical protein